MERSFFNEERLKRHLRIADLHFNGKKPDGVGLQQAELYDYLTTNGYFAERLGADILGIPEFDYATDKMGELNSDIFAPQKECIPGRGKILVDEINKRADYLYKILDGIFITKKINTFHVRNVLSLPLHLPLAVATTRLINEYPNIHFIPHYHDMPWEGPAAKKYVTHYPEIQQQIDEVMFPRGKNISSIVINSLAQEELRKRKGIDSIVIFDGLNFDRKKKLSPDHKKFREIFKIGKDDLLAGMMTRIRPNKNPQTAIAFVALLNKYRRLLENLPEGVGLQGREFGPNSKIILLITQSKDLDQEYTKYLYRYAREKNVTIAYAGHRVVADAQYEGQSGLFPFYSTYDHTDFIVYPPIWEGFGNQAIEAAWAGKPLAMFEYPVAQRDIMSHVPNIISLGTPGDLYDGKDGRQYVPQDVLETATEKMIEVLTNRELAEKVTAANKEDFRALCDIKKTAKQTLGVYSKVKYK